LSGLKPSQVAAVAAGNALEFYDFLTYAFFAGQIGRAFFPSTDPNASLLASLATFGAGFLMRPVGALVIGRVADRIGRKPAMLGSFTLMGLAVAALACIPSYARIGPLAAILAIACRLVQGFALGGEVGPSTAFLVEASPPGSRGLYVCFQYVGQQAAVTAAGLVGFTLARTLPDAALEAWGWRAALLAGVVIIPFGFVLRRRLAETLTLAEAPEPARAPRPPGVRRLIALGLVMLAGSTTVTYLGNYMTTYATATLHMSKTVGFAATIVVGVGGMAGALLGGLLSDRLGRKPVMLAPWIAILLLLVPLFQWVAHDRTPAALLTAAAVMGLAATLSPVTVLVALSEGLPRAMRGQTLGLVYAVAISIFGGSTQFTVAWLSGATHSPLAPAWYATVAVGLSLLAMLAMPETAPGRGRG
jgi:MHS family citrate/tricarballylate:H+ symporter-like MFS transporter